MLLGIVGVPLDGGGGGEPAAADPARTASDPGSPAGVLPADGRWTVTLLTGEVVEVFADADGRVSASISKHFGPIRTQRRPNGDLYVMPVAVTPLLVDRLDLEVFNVTGLIRQGYDDASTAVVPLIVEQAPAADAAAAVSALSTVESVSAQPLPSIGGVAIEVPKAASEATGALLAGLSDQMAADEADAFAVAGVERIWLDRRVTTLSASESEWQPRRLDPNLTQVGADDAWDAGLTGDGVRVAVLDTGIDAAHPDLAGQIVAQENFSDSPDVVDRVGHGTHVASLVAGTGAAADGVRRGVAPDADLLIGKVLGDAGWGMESDIIAGMEWAAPQADVVSMSLGGWPSDGSDPLSTALDQLSDEFGTLFVVAAGNDGPTSYTVSSPGSADSALTVGAVDSDDEVADFSSRGPLIDSNELKPEVVAPGVDVVAARASQTAMGEPVDAHYTSASGTSMATPHVAGAAALLAQQHPDWTGDQLRSALIGSADPIDADGYDAGAGRIDVGDGMAATVLADHDVVDVSLPHPRTEPHLETFSWTNTGTEPATVSLTAALVDRRGASADGISIEPAQLIVPAGEAGKATISLDGAGLAAGLYTGTVTAELPGDGDDVDVRLPIGVHAGPEMATLTVEATVPEAAGDGTPFGGISILNLDDYATFANLDYLYVGRSFTVDVPHGRYAVVGDVTGLDFDADVVAAVGDPDVMITGDTTVAFDGRAAVPSVPTVEGVETIPVATNVGAVLTPSAGTGGSSYVGEVYSWYPQPPVHVTPMEGDPENFSPQPPIVRLQADPIAVEAGGTEIDVKLVLGQDMAAGTQTLVAVDVGDGTDLSPARDGLAVVTLPADRAERAAITHRALEAGVALVAFVDEQRSLLTLSRFGLWPWADIPVVGAAGASATALRSAAHAGQPVTVTVTPSPFVYDVVFPESGGLDPNPVVDRREQRLLATLRETFHHDADFAGPTGERRRAISVSLMELDTVGPVPEERRAYVSPGVQWQSYVFGEGFIWPPGWPFPLPGPVALSITPETTYRSGSRQDLEWLQRPMAPGPIGGPSARNFCQPRPATRTVDTLSVDIAPFRDRPDGFGCNHPTQATFTVELDGTVIARVIGVARADLPVPQKRGDYRMTVEQAGTSPYPHRSTTTWSFPSAGDPEAGRTPIPLLVVDYDLPLDVANRPIGDTAKLDVHQVTGSQARRITSVEVWTSTDDGTTWQPAAVRRSAHGIYRVTLPDVAAGTGVSVRVDAQDAGGSRIEQTLIDAYTA